MRELSVRICFTAHCLGNVKKFHIEKGKKRTYFLMPKTHDGKVIFMPVWWKAILAKAADVFCRHQDEVKKIVFSMEVDGNPRAIPEQFYHRYYAEDRFSKHEAFFPGDVIGVTCIVPDAISDQDFGRLMTLAGKYCGISPARPNEYGFFSVVSVQPSGLSRMQQMRPEIAGERDGVIETSRATG
jgi:hypothetical protein